MHPTVYNEYRLILSELKVTGRCLEVGALAGRQALLTIDHISHMERIGINLAPPSRFQDFEVIRCDGNDMHIFPAEHFDLVLCNAMLEHDKYFWRTAAEIRRVLKTGGIAVIGVPGFTKQADVGALAIPSPWQNDAVRNWNDCTLVLPFHGAPNDYYRFSGNAVKEVFFDGYRDVRIRAVMIPPRIIGQGSKA